MDSRSHEAPAHAGSHPELLPSGVRVLAVHVGPRRVEILAEGEPQPRSRRLGRGLRPAQLVERVRELAAGWSYDAIALGLPVPVFEDRPAAEPPRFGPGWLGFDFGPAFGVPTRVRSGVALAALGSAEGGRLLYLDLGESLGTALVSGAELGGAELAQLPYRRGRSYAACADGRALARSGVRRWRRAVFDIAARLAAALGADAVVLGGEHAGKLGALPEGVRLASRGCALGGALRLWDDGARAVPLDPRARVLRRAELPSGPGDPAKQAAGRRAADYVESGMRVGLGTGSTVLYTLLALAERRLELRCAATSEATHALAHRLGLRVLPPHELGELDVAIDGADEVDPELNLLKGGGGAHTREKLVAAMARRFLVVVDEAKLVERLGATPLPLEVLPFGAGVVARWALELGAARVTRRAARSDSGNVLLDAHFVRIDDPERLAVRLAALPGLVGHGLFAGARVERVIVGGAAGVRELSGVPAAAAAPGLRGARPGAEASRWEAP